MVVGHQVWGAGPEGVMVFNDWLADCGSYEPMLPYLDAETFTYVLMDLRGYGRSIEIKGKFNSMEAAQDAVDLADHLGWTKFHAVGFSMTGMVVERLAIHFRDRIKSLVAIGPVSAAGIQMSESKRRFFLSTITDDNAVRELATRITGGRLSRQWADVKLKLARKRDPAAARAYLDMWALKENFADQAMGVDVPILVVAGEYDDEGFRPNELEKTFLTYHPNAKLEVIENCGHCPMQETPVRLQTVMEAWLKQHRNG